MADDVLAGRLKVELFILFSYIILIEKIFVLMTILWIKFRSRSGINSSNINLI